MPWGMAGISPHAQEIADPPRAANVMLAVPAYGGITPQTQLSIANAMTVLQAAGISNTLLNVAGESQVHRARNYAAAHFLASDCDTLVFIDSDIGFAGAALMRLLQHDHPVVAGIYRRGIADRISFACTPLDATGFALSDANGCIRLAEVATGFLAIRREVFVRIAEAYDIKQVVRGPDVQPGAWRDHLHAFFTPWLDPESRMELSEDYLFCRRWREIGGEIWADPAIILDHWKTVPLSADPLELLMPARVEAA